MHKYQMNGRELQLSQYIKKEDKRKPENYRRINLLNNAINF
jgi:hypothetical protein